MKKQIDKKIHPLTIQIKEYFSYENNGFIKEVKKMFIIEEVQIYLDEEDDCGVIVVFEEKERGLSCITFTDGYAYIEYFFVDFPVQIPFCYYETSQETIANFHYSVKPKLSLITKYNNYGIIGQEKLFQDILNVLNDIYSKALYIEYLNNKWDSWRKNSSKCRLATNSEEIGYTKKWKDKYRQKNLYRKIYL